jgi:hypothetical protein
VSEQQHSFGGSPLDRYVYEFEMPDPGGMGDPGLGDPAPADPAPAPDPPAWTGPSQDEWGAVMGYVQQQQQREQQIAQVYGVPGSQQDDAPDFYDDPNAWLEAKLAPHIQPIQQYTEETRMAEAEERARLTTPRPASPTSSTSCRARSGRSSRPRHRSSPSSPVSATRTRRPLHPRHGRQPGHLLRQVGPAHDRARPAPRRRVRVGDRHLERAADALDDAGADPARRRRPAVLGHGRPRAGLVRQLGRAAVERSPTRRGSRSPGWRTSPSSATAPARSSRHRVGSSPGLTITVSSTGTARWTSCSPAPSGTSDEVDGADDRREAPQDRVGVGLVDDADGHVRHEPAGVRRRLGQHHVLDERGHLHPRLLLHRRERRHDLTAQGLEQAAAATGTFEAIDKAAVQQWQGTDGRQGDTTTLPLSAQMLDKASVSAAAPGSASGTSGSATPP